MICAINNMIVLLDHEPLEKGGFVCNGIKLTTLVNRVAESARLLFEVPGKGQGIPRCSSKCGTRDRESRAQRVRFDSRRVT